MDIKQVFPRIKYHATIAPDGIRVRDAEHEKRLGAGWVETPADFGKEAEPEPEIEETPEEMLAKVDAILHHKPADRTKAVKKAGK